jgi:TolB-like protein/cytochrome c-type biogenesis protein CcmH/NrfG
MLLPPETRLGPYEIRSLLGSGGMGEVYLAHDTRLGRDVAVKVLPESVSGNHDRRRRFEQEARAAASLNHPGILAVHDVGWHEGSPYIVSELLEGETLRARLGKGSFTVKQALEVAIPLARALAVAHEKGIVHRDLKPENVFLTRDGQVKVLDFGLAKLLLVPEPGPESQIDTKSTASGIVLGTAAYMSPEQVRGHGTDAQSDVFSFGVVLYEMLAGRLPFRGDSAADVMAAVLHQEPPKLLDLEGAVSPQLERVTERCLQKSPERRFQSARDLATTLEAVSDAESGGPSRPLARGLRRVARRPWAAVLVLLIIGVVAGWGVWRSRTGATAAGVGSPIGSLAVLPLVNLSGDAEQDYFADGITEALIANLAKIRAIKVISRTSVMQYKATKKPLPDIARELKVDAVVEGSVLRSGNRVRVTAQLIRAATDEHLWAETYDRNLTDILVLQGDIARTIAGEVRIKVTPQEEARLRAARSVDPETYALYLKGRHHLNTTWTQESLAKASAHFEQATQRDAAFAPAYAGLAEAHAYTAGVYVRPQEGYPRAKAWAEKALAIDPDIPEARAMLGLVRLNYDWHFAEAEKELQRAVDVGPGSARARFWYSFYLVLAGRSDEAVAEARRMLELDPATPTTNFLFGWILLNARRFDEAIAQLQKTRDLDPNDPLADSLLAWGYALTGRYAEALAACDRYKARVAVAEDRLGGHGYAWVSALSGRRAEAIRVLESLKRLAKDQYVAPAYIAAIYSGLGDKERAFEWLERGYSERSPGMAELKSDPMFGADMRRDPRYDQLMRRVGIPAF